MTPDTIGRITKSPPTKIQSVVLGALINAGGRISRGDLIDMVYPDPDHAPEDEGRTLAVHVCNIRKILKPPVEINPLHGIGYTLNGVPGISSSSGLPISAEPTGSELVILEFLMDKRWHTVGSVIFNLYQFRTTPKTGKHTVFLFVMRLKRKLRKGWMIENDWQKGYRLREVKT